MRTIRKFFDKDGKETDDKAKAIEVHELQVDDAGRVVKDSIYKAEE